MDVEDQVDVEESATDAPQKSKRPPRRQKASGQNYKARKNEKTRLKFGALKLNDRQRQRDRELYPQGIPQAEIPLTRLLGLPDASPTMRIVLVPFASTGLGFAVQALYVRYFTELNPYCTVFQLYRYTLAQFELQRYETHLKAHSSYPHTDWFFRFPDLMRAAAKGYCENFRLLVSIIESYGSFKHGDQEFLTVVPSIAHAPECITFQTLRGYCEEWAVEASAIKQARNCIPGVVLTPDGLLHNMDDIIPERYDANALGVDCATVRSAFEAMKTKYSDFIAACTFAGVGKPSAFVTTNASITPDRIRPLTAPEVHRAYTQEAKRAGILL